MYSLIYIRFNEGLRGGGRGSDGEVGQRESVGGHVGPRLQVGVHHGVRGLYLLYVLRCRRVYTARESCSLEVDTFFVISVN